MFDGLQVTLTRPDSSRALDITQEASALRWSSAAVGGFGSCSFTIDRTAKQPRRFPYLSLIRVTYGPLVLFEGLIEDRHANGTQITAYGLQRRLEQTSVQRVWTQRTLSYSESVNNGTGDIRTLYQLVFGQIDPTDLTKIGVRFTGRSNQSWAAPQGAFGAVQIPNGLTGGQVKCYLDGQGAQFGVNMRGAIHSSSDGSIWTNEANATADGVLAATLTTGATMFRVGAEVYANGPQPGATDIYDFYNVRYLGTNVEDVAGTSTGGGFYGGTILRDLIGLLPELTLGLVESGSDFTIENIERTVRSNALSVVQEIAGYYGRFWGVWDSDVPGVGRFDWRTRNLDEPNWIAPLASLADVQIDETIDNLVRTIYLSYVDAASLLAKNVTASSTDQRNPYVRKGMAKDANAQVSFLMTGNSAQQLATKLIADQGGAPIATGKVTVPINRLLAHVSGVAKPAWAIRGGDTILIPDLPKSEPFRSGRDSETLFLVAQAEVQQAQGVVSLDVDGYQRTSDVLLARLAAVTRTVTG